MKKRLSMKNKKKNVFLAGLMVLMMIVSLLSGMNLSVAKAAAVPNPGQWLKFTLIKEWEVAPGKDAKATFHLVAKQDNTVVGEEDIELSLTQTFYEIEESNEGRTWKVQLFTNKTYKDIAKPVNFTIEEVASKYYNSAPAGPQRVTDGAEIKFTNTRIRKKLTIEKKWNEGAEKTGTKPTLTANGKDAGEVLLYKSNDWTHGIMVPVYDFAGKPIEYVVTESKIGDKNTKNSQTVTLVDEKNEAVDKTVTLTDDNVNKGDIQVTNTWVGTVGQASFGLFKKGGTDKLNYTVNVENAGAPDKSTVKVENLPLTDELGNAVQYEIKELDANNKIVASGDAITLNNRNYRVTYDEKGNITNTEIINGGNVVPVIPSTPVVPETTPLVPVTTPTVPETTPVVTVPDDTTPQGDVNTSNENKKTTPSDENTDDNDGVVDVDEDKVPEGAAKVKKDTSKEVPVNVDEDSTPKGTANLPKTGGTVGGLLSILGMGLVALGLAIRKRK